jgi:hypothetical protein
MVFYKLNLVLEMYFIGQPWSRQYGIPNISQAYRSPRPVTGIALLLVCVSGEDGWTAVQEGRGAVCIASLGGDCQHANPHSMHADNGSATRGSAIRPV